PTGATSDWTEEDQSGSRIGPYKLLQQIGEGGMGVVYMAEQVEPVKRRVAIKIIKPGMGSKRVVARFEAERQALAMMDHPNIARVLDAGTTPAGLPFFVMELVHGLPITEYCDQKQLAPAARLELFIQVCQGVQHAHQKGIIHRDLKPSNLLVAEYDERPVPKIIDFGVAKAISQQLTEKTLFTEFGQIIGTLEYMSPEQAKRNQLDIDTRSDIYSLGIVLYALLTGETPFGQQRLQSAAWDEMLRIIREEEPLRPSVKLSGSQRLDEVAVKRQMEPSRLMSSVRGDLDWIVMKSLEKDRNHRYATAHEMADDLARHLASLPVLARPPSLADRTLKLARRHHKGLLTTGVVLLVMLAAWVWATGQARRARMQREAAVRAHEMGLAVAMQNSSRSLGQASSTPLGQAADWDAVEGGRVLIEQLLEQGAVNDDLLTQAQELLTEMKQAREQRDWAELLEEVLLANATKMTLASWQQMESRIRAMFRKHGIDLDKTPPPEVAEQIRNHRFQTQLVDALELWIGTRGQMQMMGGPILTAADMQPWADAMYVADDDPLRTGVRRQLYSRSLSADALDALVAESNLDEHTPRTLAWLAVTYVSSQAPQRADEIFQYALQRFPQDAMLNYDYALVLKIRGDTLNKQAQTLEADGDQDAADELHQRAKVNYQQSIRLYNRCVALRPDVAGFWFNMAELLDHVDEPEAAAEARARGEACPSEPATPNFTGSRS
ncbi:MAG: serine/threonine-protein kinase, partial [Planctomycetota bacterium]